MTFTQLIQRAENAKVYRALRQENPTVKAVDVFAFMSHQGHESSLKQFTCKHRWSSGYYDDGEFDRECAVYCLHCGLSGDI